MLSIAVATLRTRWVSFAGAFLALMLGSAVIAAMVTALAATSTTPFPGPQRFATAPIVVIPRQTVRLTTDGRPVDLTVRRPGGLTPDVVAPLASTGKVIADRTFSAQVAGGPSDQVGHAWSAAAFTPYRLVAGRAPSTAGEIAVGGGDSALVNRQVLLRTDTGRSAYTVTGVTAPVWFEHAVFFTDEEAARISPRVDAVVAYGPVDVVRTSVSGAAQVLTGDARQAAEPDASGGADQLSDAEAMAGTSTVLGVGVAIFVVIATFTVVTDQRRRELALLRTVGATPWQMRQMVMTEAAVVGAVASAFGCVLGSLLSRSLNTWMIDHGVAPPWFTIDFAVLPLLVAFAVGLTSALLGASVASWRSARVRPTAALHDAAVEQRVMTVARWLLSIGLLAAGAYAAGTTIVGEPSRALSVKHYLPTFVLIAGFALLTPVILGPVARLATWPLGHLRAGSMVVRAAALTAGRRTAGMVAPIVVGLGLAASILAVQATADDTVTAELRRSTRADFTVVPSETAVIDPQTVAAIRSVPAADVMVWATTLIHLATVSDTYIDTLDARTVDLATLSAIQKVALVAGSLSQLADDSLIIDQGLARRNSLRVGDQVKAYLPDGSGVILRIAAETKTGVAGETVYLSAVHAVGESPTRVDVMAHPGATPADVGAALRAAVRGHDVQVVPIGVYLDAVRGEQQQETRQAIAVILGIALVYSFIAVANTVVIAASGRRHEIVALSLAGATRRQITRFIAAESLLVVLIGAMLAAGAAATVIACQRAALSRLAANVPLSIPWLLLGEIFAVCTAIATTAAILSALRMLRGGATGP
ncbi:ABC transporter permease [Kribbella capetownensis]|uniref:ABC transporter permease n=1 Tax=Kribbella capetownensis TaxID=1572659 RepID=A0A4R0IU36_9ACTN|nr:ABC transporter permease [Kribbella capetownensis]TCC37423.1 ABC transporter permease [Kribbella capetownensis]